MKAVSHEDTERLNSEALALKRKRDGQLFSSVSAPIYHLSSDINCGHVTLDCSMYVYCIYTATYIHTHNEL